MNLEANLDDEVHRHPKKCATYELNLWTQDALASGISFDLALLGRAVRRHNFVTPSARYESCLEWHAMIQDALADPIGTRRQWRRLLERYRPLSQ